MKKFLLRIVMMMMWVPFVMASCLGDGPTVPDFNEQLAKDGAAIDAYLLGKGIVAQVHPGGIRYVIHRFHTTDNKPTLDSCVTANYVGKFLSDGQTFDHSESLPFPLLGVIAGWQYGIPLINEGDSITLYVPSGLAYGYYGYGPIPSNANLYFNIGLIKVGRTYTPQNGAAAATCK